MNAIDYIRYSNGQGGARLVAMLDATCDALDRRQATIDRLLDENVTLRAQLAVADELIAWHAEVGR